MYTGLFNIVLVCDLLVVLRANLNPELFEVFVKVHTDKSVNVVDDQFVGVTLDTSLIADGWAHFDFK